MVLGEVISVEAEPVVCLDQLQPLFELLLERHIALIHVIKDAELHFVPPSCWFVL